MAVCTSDPEVAVTVTVEITGGGGDDLLPEDPPLHPLSKPNPATLTPSSNTSCTLLLFRNPMKKSTPASAASGKSGCRFLCKLADVVAVVTVKVVVAAAVPDGVTVAGEKLHASPAGSPEHANETAETNNPCGEIEIVAVPLLPAVTVIAVGAAVTEKSAGTLITYAALATELLELPLAVAIASRVSVDATVIGVVFVFIRIESTTPEKPKIAVIVDPG